MEKKIKILIIVIILLFISSFAFAQKDTIEVDGGINPITSAIPPDDNTTAIILAFMATTSTTLGLWFTYKTNNNKRNEKEEAKHKLDEEKARLKTIEDNERASLILKRIEESDELQTSQIRELSNTVSEINNRLIVLEENDETSLSIKKLKFKLEEVSNFLLGGVRDQSVKEVSIYGIEKMYTVFTGYMLQDFKVDIRNLELQLNVASKQAFSFYPPGSKLDKDINEHLRLELIYIASNNIKKFILDLNSLKDLRNGVRRSTYITICVDFIENSLLSSLELYNMYKNK